MLYALTRTDGSVAVTMVLPKEIIVDGKTLPVTFVNGSEKYLEALDAVETPSAREDMPSTAASTVVRFPLPSSDMRTYEADSVPGATLTFYDIQTTMDDSVDTFVSYQKITVDQIPASRSYRNAWAVSGKTLVHDMAKARDIHRDKLREARGPMLAALDVAYQRADERSDGAEKARIAAEKQKLRDITGSTQVASAATVEALALLTVDYLLAHPS